MTKVYKGMVVHSSVLTDVDKWWSVNGTKHWSCALAFWQRHPLTMYTHRTKIVNQSWRTWSQLVTSQKAPSLQKALTSGAHSLHTGSDPKGSCVQMNSNWCRPVDIQMLLPKTLWVCRHGISNNYNLFHSQITVIFGKKNKHLRDLTIFIFRGPYIYKVYFKINSPFVLKLFFTRLLIFFHMKGCFHTFWLYTWICIWTFLKDSILNIWEEIQWWMEYCWQKSNYTDIWIILHYKLTMDIGWQAMGGH